MSSLKTPGFVTSFKIGKTLLLLLLFILNSALITVTKHFF